MKEELEQKEYIIAQLQKMLFGPKSERFVKQEVPDNQTSLFEGLVENLPVQTEGEKEQISYERKKPAKKKEKSGRQPLPEGLPCIRTVIEPEEDVSGMKKIGEEITEVLDIIPPEFRVIQIVRPKYAKPGSGTEDLVNPIVIADMPLRVIDKGIPSTRLLAYIVISKFVNHLPYYRQIEMFKRIGVNIKSNTINGWIAKVCVLLKPLYDAFCKYHFSKNYLQGDETRIRVLKVKKNGKKGKAHTGWYWVYFDPIDNQVVFIFDPGRGRVYPAEHLKGFSGKLQTDGLSVYSAFDKLDYIELFGCMAHIRRKFHESLDNDKRRAEYILLRIQKLYAIEQEARQSKFTPEQRLELRQKEAAPIMAEIKAYLDEHELKVLPKSAIGNAISHALRRWKYLERYLNDGTVEIDNNLVENAIRIVAMGRKNYLFSGSERGAEWGAMIYTFVSSALRQGHNPLEYLTDILRRLPDTKKSELHKLFPANWSPNPASEYDCF